jgi:hypothetical protein
MNFHGRICAMMVNSLLVWVENGSLVAVLDRKQYRTDWVKMQ